MHVCVTHQQRGWHQSLVQPRLQVLQKLQQKLGLLVQLALPYIVSDELAFVHL